MDNTHDWMDDVTEILDQHAANERRLQGLPAEDKPEDSEAEPKVSEEEAKESEGEPIVSEQEVKDSEGEVSEEKADVSEVEPEVKELDEDEKEELRQENKSLLEAFVVSRNIVVLRSLDLTDYYFNMSSIHNMKINVLNGDMWLYNIRDL